MFQSFFTILVMIGLLFLPDSPQWLTMHGRMAEAPDVTSRLVGKPVDDPEVQMEIQNIKEAIEIQKPRRRLSFPRAAQQRSIAELPSDVAWDGLPILPALLWH